MCLLRDLYLCLNVFQPVSESKFQPINVLKKMLAIWLIEAYQIQSKESHFLSTSFAYGIR